MTGYRFVRKSFTWMRLRTRNQQSWRSEADWGCGKNRLLIRGSFSAFLFDKMNLKVYLTWVVVCQVEWKVVGMVIQGQLVFSLLIFGNLFYLGRVLLVFWALIFYLSLQIKLHWQKENYFRYCKLKKIIFWSFLNVLHYFFVFKVD
jgi:hypothetical protein